MANNAIKDYEFVCRTCLSSDAEFYKLDAPIISDASDDRERVSLMECLRYCTRLDDEHALPIYICTECSSALQVAYTFIVNAIDTDRILRQKLCTQNNKNTGSGNGGCTAPINPNKFSLLNSNQLIHADDIKKEPVTMKFRCKICQEKLDSKKSLKEHVKLHMDIISYNCDLCQFVSKKRSLLSEHYLIAHDVEAARDQLKPHTAQPVVKLEPSVKIEPRDDAKDFLYTSEYFTPVGSTGIPPMPITTAPTDVDVEEELLKLSSNCEEVRVVGSDGGNVAIVTGSVITTEAANSNSDLSNDLNMNGLLNGSIDGGVVDFHVGNEMSVGNQFIVLSDGTVQEVIGNDVVIEYINAGGGDEAITLNNLLDFNGIVQIDPQNVNLNEAIAPGGDTMPVTDAISMDVNDMIIEDNELTESSQEIYVDVDGSNMDVEIPHSVIEMPRVKNIKCKICTKNFISQDQLKTHMLTHNEIPHFFCDQCSFYTFYKIDLTHHYTNRHGVQPTLKQLQPKNKVIDHNVKHTYTCDMCLFETNMKANLRRHYLSKHQIEASEVQLRPAIIDNDSSDTFAPAPAKKPKRMPKTDYAAAYSCKKCHKVFYNRDTLQDHYKDQCVPEHTYLQLIEPQRVVVNCSTAADKRQTAPTMLIPVSQPTLDAQYVMPSNCEAPMKATVSSTTVTATPAHIPTTTTAATTTAAASITNASSDVMDAQQLIDAHINGMPDNMLPILEETVQTFNCSSSTTAAAAPVTSTATTTTMSSTSSLGVAAATIPSDAIPQIVETDNSFDNEIDFDFNGDTLFEDFDDENDGDNDNEEFKDLLLTSDEELDDLLHNSYPSGDNSNSETQRPQCVQCNKIFYSQYQFENHMFVHRGLAPYRCEMCTNLYNTKRALIRHYRGVHNRIPTRDMVQAKGDKVSTDHLVDENINLEEQKAITLMCSKCSFESIDMANLQIHLNTAHGINDDKFIIHKLPYECQRCIRSFASKTLLLRHVERHHSAVTIIQQQQEQQQSLLFKNNHNNNNITTQETFVMTSHNNNNNNNNNNTNSKNNSLLNNNNNNNNALIGANVQAAYETTITTSTTTTVPPACTTVTAAAATTTTTRRATDTATESTSPRVIVMSNNTNTAIATVTSSPSSTSSSSTTTASTSAALTTTYTKTASDASCGLVDVPDVATTAAADDVFAMFVAATSPPTSERETTLLQTLSNYKPDNNNTNVSQQFLLITPTSLLQPQHQQHYKNISLNFVAGELSGQAAVDVNDFGVSEELRPEPQQASEQSVGIGAEFVPIVGEVEGGIVEGAAAVLPPSHTKDVAQKSQFRCGGCGFRCPTFEELAAHSKTPHLSVCNFECGICSCTYDTISGLKFHMRRHMERVHKCTLCPKAFVQATELRLHQVSHNLGEQGFQCDECDKRFGYAHHLKRHREVQHQGKRHCCPMKGCDGTFTSKATMNVHMLDHTGVMPYKCKFCNRQFKKRMLLRQHSRKIHNIELTDAEVAEIYRNTMGHANRHDFPILESSSSSSINFSSLHKNVH